MLLLLCCLQCDKVAIVKDSSVVYFGPYNATAINKHMPVDHMMGATVEGNESATAPAAAATEKVHEFLAGNPTFCSDSVCSVRGATADVYVLIGKSKLALHSLMCADQGGKP
jgi:hypothetical protein